MAFAMKVIHKLKRSVRSLGRSSFDSAGKLASGQIGWAEVAVSKTTGISVSTRCGEAENVEFNSDGALGITGVSPEPQRQRLRQI